MNICQTCGDLKGIVTLGDSLRLPQRCECQVKRDGDWGNPNAPRWPRHAFNQAWELCYCCCREVIPSGSKWSLFFCEDCKQRIVDFNERCGWAIIPIGRHSIHAQCALSGEAAQNLEAVSSFVTHMQGYFKRTDRLKEWTARRIRSLAQEAGFPKDQDVPLQEYLKRLPVSAAVKTQAFYELAHRFLRIINAHTESATCPACPLTLQEAECWERRAWWVLNSVDRQSGEPVFKFCYEPTTGKLWLGHGTQNHKTILNVRSGRTLDAVVRGIYFRDRKLIYLRGHPNAAWLRQTMEMLKAHGLPSDHRVVWGPRAARKLRGLLEGL